MAGYIGGKVAVSAPQQIETKHTVTATASQTSITNVGYTVGAVHVYQNGVRLVDGTDYTATNGSTVTLETGATEGDQIVIVSHGSFETGDVVSKASGGTFSGNVAVSGSVTATSLVVPDGSIPLVDLDIDGGTDIGAALVDADLMVVDDGAGGTNRKATMSRLATYMGTKITGGSMVYLASSGAISNAASVAFTQFDASKYDHYQFWMQSVAAATDNVTLVCQVSTDGGSNYDSTNGNYHTNQTTDAIGLMVSTNMGNQSQESISGQFSLFNPHTSDKYTTASASNMAHLWNGGSGGVGGASLDTSSRAILGSAHLTAQDVDAVKFIMSSGNIASGEIVMYGIANGT